MVTEQLTQKGSSMHFEGSLQKVVMKNIDLKDMSGGVKKGN